MEVIPQELCRLAEACTGAATAVTDGWTSALGSLRVGGTAAGNTAAGGAVLAAHAEMVDVAGTAIGRLAGVLDQDLDALLLCAFDFSTTDEATARDLEATGALLPFPFPFGG